MKLYVYITLILSIASAGTAVAADWQQELAELKEDVQLLKRRVDAKYNAPVSMEVGELYGQAGKRSDAIRELNIRLDDLDHQLTESGNNFDKINRDIEIRIKLLEGKQIPQELSAPVSGITEIYAAPVAKDAARAVVGDEIQGGDLAPIDEYSDFEFENQGEL